MLEIKNLHAGIDGKEIIKGLSLNVGEGEVHAIMGPNGSGKSTLANVLAGRPRYEVTRGSVTFEGKDLLAADRGARPGGGVPGDAVSGRDSRREQHLLPQSRAERAAEASRRGGARRHRVPAA